MKKIDELKSVVDTLVSNKAQSDVCLFFRVKTEGGYIVKQAVIDEKSEEEVKDGVFASLTSLYQSWKDDSEMSVMNLSDIDDRSNAIYYYDLDYYPNFFKELAETHSPHVDEYFSTKNNRIFQFEKDNLNEIDAIIFRVGTEDNYLNTYRKNIPLNVYKQGRGALYITKSNTQFTILKDDLLKLDNKIDMLRIGEEVYVLNVKFLERYGDFKDKLEKEAHSSVEAIKGLDLLDNPNLIDVRIGNDVTFARKLAKVNNTSPVFSLPKSRVITFAKNHVTLKKTFKFTEEDKIKIESKKSQDLFIRLLNDDFLHSLLTDNDYVTPAKDKCE